MTPEQQSTFKKDQDRKQFCCQVAVNIAVAQSTHDTSTSPTAIAKRAWDIAEALHAQREERGFTFDF